MSHDRRRFALVLGAQASIALVLIASLLAPLAWTAAASSVHQCELACCAGRAPHAAGSCMTGSCHAGLAHHPSEKHLRPNFGAQPSETFCGLPRGIWPTGIAFLRQVAFGGSPHSSNHQPSIAPEQPQATAIALTKPCTPACGSCASGSANPNRQSNQGSVAHACRPHPPSRGRFTGVESSLMRKLSELCRQCAPRGPPVSFS